MESKSTKLNTINLSEAIQRLDTNDITELCVGGVYNLIGEKGATKISNSLIKNTSLTHLTLFYNSIHDSGATKISNSLIKNTSLTHLNLSLNGISSSGATSISNALIKNTSLIHLQLENNWIQSSGATKISNSLIKNTSLTHLNLSLNAISSPGATSISNALIKNTSLTELLLIGNTIDDVEVLKSIGDELNTNKGNLQISTKISVNIANSYIQVPHKFQTKKEQLWAWIPMKILLNV